MFSSRGYEDSNNSNYSTPQRKSDVNNMSCINDTINSISLLEFKDNEKNKYYSPMHLRFNDTADETSSPNRNIYSSNSLIDNQSQISIDMSSLDSHDYQSDLDALLDEIHMQEHMSRNYGDVHDNYVDAIRTNLFPKQTPMSFDRTARGHGKQNHHIYFEDNFESNNNTSNISNFERVNTQRAHMNVSNLNNRNEQYQLASDISLMKTIGRKYNVEDENNFEGDSEDKDRYGSYSNISAYSPYHSQRVDGDVRTPPNEYEEWNEYDRYQVPASAHQIQHRIDDYCNSNANKGRFSTIPNPNTDRNSRPNHLRFNTPASKKVNEHHHHIRFESPVNHTPDRSMSTNRSVSGRSAHRKPPISPGNTMEAYFTHKYRKYNANTGHHSDSMDASGIADGTPSKRLEATGDPNTFKRATIVASSHRFNRDGENSGRNMNADPSTACVACTTEDTLSVIENVNNASLSESSISFHSSESSDSETHSSDSGSSKSCNNNISHGASSNSSSPSGSKNGDSCSNAGTTCSLDSADKKESATELSISASSNSIKVAINQISVASSGKDSDASEARQSHGSDTECSGNDSSSSCCSPSNSIDSKSSCSSSKPTHSTGQLGKPVLVSTGTQTLAEVIEYGFPRDLKRHEFGNVPNSGADVQQLNNSIPMYKSSVPSSKGDTTPWLNRAPIPNTPYTTGHTAYNIHALYGTTPYSQSDPSDREYAHYTPSQLRYQFIAKQYQWSPYGQEDNTLTNKRISMTTSVPYMSLVDCTHRVEYFHSQFWKKRLLKRNLTSSSGSFHLLKYVNRTELL